MDISNVYRKPEIDKGSKKPLPVRVNCIPVSIKSTGFSLRYISNMFDSIIDGGA